MTSSRVCLRDHLAGLYLTHMTPQTAPATRNLLDRIAAMEARAPLAVPTATRPSPIIAQAHAAAERYHSWGITR